MISVGILHFKLSFLATSIGNSFRNSNIPVSSVLYSPNVSISKAMDMTSPGVAASQSQYLSAVKGFI